MPIASPCTDNCAMDPETGLCRGCFRSMDEIAAWSSLSDPQRQQVLDSLRARKGEADTPDC
jgi:hypothetical protein